MLVAQKYDLMDLLSKKLIEIFQSTEMTFLDNKFIYNYETVFLREGLLSLFLFDKQNLLDKFLLEEIKDENITATLFVDQNKESPLGHTIHLEHNTKSLKNLEKIIKFLMGCVLTNDLFLKSQKRIVNKQEMLVYDITENVRNFSENFYKVFNHEHIIPL